MGGNHRPHKTLNKMAKENQKPTTPNLQQALEITQQVTWHPCTFAVDADGDLVMQQQIADLKPDVPVELILTYRRGSSIGAIKSNRDPSIYIKGDTIVVQYAEQRLKDPYPYLSYGAYAQDENSPKEIIDQMYNSFNQQ